MDKTFSLLWPDSHNKSSFSLNNNVIGDLNLEKVLKRSVIYQLSSIPVELTTIEYRNDILMDIYKNPNLYNILSGFSLSCSYTSQLLSILNRCDIKSSGLQQLTVHINNFLSSDEFKKINKKNEIPSSEDINNVTVSIKFDNNQIPTGINVLSVNDNNVDFNNQEPIEVSSYDLNEVCDIVHAEIKKRNLENEYESDLITNFLPSTIIDEIKYYTDAVSMILSSKSIINTGSHERSLNIINNMDAEKNYDELQKIGVNQILFQLGLYSNDNQEKIIVDSILTFSNSVEVYDNEFSQVFFKINQLIKSASTTSMILINNSIPDKLSTVNLFLAKGLLKNISRLNCKAVITTTHEDLQLFA